jgi:ubiquinone/menaquinone biosynthesis C-methylase UbiE
MLMDHSRRGLWIVVVVLGLVLSTGFFALRTRLVQSWLQEKQAQIQFNWIYTKGNEYFSHAPTAFLVECVKQSPPGDALDVAMGQGRNAVYLAQQGWRVTGFDVAQEGLKIAEAQAAAQGLHINCVRASSEDFEYGDSSWDLIVMAYTAMAFHEPELMNRVKKSLRPGGLVVVETFLEWFPESGKPRVPGLPGPGELRRIFSEFEILTDQEVHGTSEWFTRKTRLIRFCARKPDSLTRASGGRFVGKRSKLRL